MSIIWKCRSCGKELGEVFRDSSGIHRLQVGQVTLIGTGEVTCSCGCLRHWEPDRELLERLLQKVMKNRELRDILPETHSDKPIGDTGDELPVC